MQKFSSGKNHCERQVLFVTGLSGAGKSSILRILEDLGYELIDNAPLQLLNDIIEEVSGSMVIGVDSRTRGFESSAVLELLSRLRKDPALNVQLIYATAETDVLLRRYTATRRRHPLATRGTVIEGIEAEIKLMDPLRQEADLIIDTSDLPPPELRVLVETRYGQGKIGGKKRLTLALMSFAFSRGLPREADMVFDARFLQNPYYVAELSSLTGLDQAVKHYVEADPDYKAFVDQIYQMICLILPRFVQEGKKYATIAVGCSGGHHRSVTIIEELAKRIAQPQEKKEGWSVLIMHRELARQGIQNWRWVSNSNEQSNLSLK